MVDTLLGTFFPLPPPEDTPPLFMVVSMIVLYNTLYKYFTHFSRRSTTIHDNKPQKTGANQQPHHQS